jgi:uncharacterized protein (TIGR02147 family)
MATKPVFEFRDYKAYLKHTESKRPHRGRGFRADLARATGCQTAYVSQVLNGKANFSLEQSHAINELLIHSKEEARFFLTLVEYVRAGTQKLRSHFLEIMEEQIQRQLNLKERFKVKESLSLEDQTTYYGEWAYAAIHIAVTVGQLQTAEALAEFFNLPKLKIQKVLKFLTTTGLVTEIPGGKYQIGTARLHLGNDSPLLAKHHTNWRLQAMNSFERESERDLHYTSIVSLSLEDVLQIKSRFVREIDAYNLIVKDSKEETICCLALDFFTMARK